MSEMKLVLSAMFDGKVIEVKMIIVDIAMPREAWLAMGSEIGAHLHTTIGVSKQLEQERPAGATVQ